MNSKIDKIDWYLNVKPNAPLWMQAVDSVEAMVKDGSLCIGDELPRHEILCEKMGLSHVTLQKSLSELSRRGIITRHRRRGTVVNGIPSAKTTVKKLAVMTRALFDQNLSPFDMLAARSLVKAAGDSNCNLRFFHNQYVGEGKDDEIDPYIIEEISGRKIDGLIVIGLISRHRDDIVEKLRCDRIPFIEMSDAMKKGRGGIIFDYADMTRKAVEWLVSKRCGKLAIIGYRPNGANDKGTVSAAWDDAIGAGNLISLPSWKLNGRGATDKKLTEAIIRMFKSSGNRPDGLFISDDIMAKKVSEVLRNLEVKIPGELHVLTHGNKNSGLEYFLPFARIEFDIEYAMKKAMELMTAMIDGNKPMQIKVQAHVNSNNINGRLI